MKNCIACNALLEDEAKFCSTCRAEQPKKIIEKEPEQKIGEIKKIINILHTMRRRGITR